MEGLKKLRTGNLLLILAPILITVGTVSGLAGFGFLFGGNTLAGAGFSALGFLALVGELMLLGAVYMFMKGFGILRDVDPELGIGRTGSMLVLVAAILMILGFIIVLAATMAVGLAGAFAGVILFPLAMLLYFIGIIMTAIGFYRVGSKYGEGLVKVGGILLIFYTLAFIGAILNYIGLGSIIRKKSGQ